MKLLEHASNRLRGRYGPIGVDVGARHVKLAQLVRASGSASAVGAGGGWRAITMASFPRAQPGDPFDAREAARLAGVIDRQGFAGRAVVAAMPAANLFTSVLELPPRAPGVPLLQIARLELARVHQREPGGFEFGQWEVPAPARASQSTYVMAVGCAHESAGVVLDAFESQDVIVRAIDAESCALLRACRPLLPAVGAMSAILDLGFSAARLTIVCRGVIVYTRAIEEAAIERLGRNLQRELDVDEQTITQLLGEDFLTVPSGGAREGLATRSNASCASDDVRTVVAAHFDALVKEINVACSYATHQYAEPAVATLLLTGGGAGLPGVAEHLGATLGMPVRLVTPGMLIAGQGNPLARSPAMVGALGLAMYGSDPAEAWA